MRTRSKIGLQGQLLLTLGVITVTLGLATALISFWSLERTLRRDALERTDSLADLGAAQISGARTARGGPLMTGKERILPALRQLYQQPGVEEIAVVTASGQRIQLGASGIPLSAREELGLRDALQGRRAPARSRASPGETGARLLVAYRPVAGPGGRPAAALRVVISEDRLVSDRLEITIWIIVLLGIIEVLLVLLFGLHLLRRRVIGPIRNLERAVSRVASGVLDVSVAVEGADELARLTHRFNGMVEKLAERERRLDSQPKELRAKQEELDRSWGALIKQAKLASLGHLAAGVAHELGNPMSAILGYLELAQDEEDPGQRAAYLERVREEMYRMDRIIRALLETARPSEEPVERTDLVGLIRRAAELVKAQRRMRDVDIRLQMESVPPVSGSDKLTQVFVNLLLNAGDAMVGRGEVRISAQVEPDSVLLTITDTGPGIPEEMRDSIFEPFVSTKPPGEGTGLGLAISQSILRAMQAEIRLASPQPGQGAAFEVRLQRWDQTEAGRQ